MKYSEKSFSVLNKLWHDQQTLEAYIEGSVMLQCSKRQFALQALISSFMQNIILILVYIRTVADSILY